jgi:hypothetical protein
MRAAKAGALYFALAFAAGWVLGPIRELLLTPRFGPLAALLLEAPFMILAMALAAPWVVRRLAVPREGRPAMGVAALVLLLAAEAILSAWLRGLPLRAYIARFATAPGALSLALFLLFAALPSLLPVAASRTPGRLGR